jgi:CheY-like chemotaxis protein
MARILIADDSEASRSALRSLIQEKAAILKPDLVILDYRMPNLDGLQAGQAIHTADPSVPLLLFTLDDIVPPLLELALGGRISRRPRKE